MQEIFKTDLYKANEENNTTFMDYTEKMEALVKAGYTINSHEFHRMDGYNGCWVIVATKQPLSSDLGPN